MVCHLKLTHPRLLLVLACTGQYWDLLLVCRLVLIHPRLLSANLNYFLYGSLGPDPKEEGGGKRGKEGKW